MSDKKHMVMLLGRKAICPECSGVLSMVGEDRMRCIDCKEWFDILEPGRMEGEILIRGNVYERVCKD